MKRILLNTSYDPGSRDPGRTYTHVGILALRAAFDRRQLVLYLGYYDDEGAEGLTSIRAVLICDRPREDPPGTDFSDLVVDQDLTCSEILEHLASGLFPGTVVTV